jgi:glycerol-3-phosphate acyltransferase PlsX
LAVDAHGGDHGLSATLPAAFAALREDSGIEIVMVGRREDIEAALADTPDASDKALRERLDFHYVESALPMDVRTVTALRKGEGSSLWEAIRLVADARADGCVSGGNTGAMMALGVRLVGMLPGIERPVLMAYIPHASGFTAAHALLKEVPINYIGFVEGNDLYAGTVDVAVCDGFSGNLIIKASEGLARMTMSQLRQAFAGSLRGRLGAWLARPALVRMLAGLDPSAHNGAPLLGLRGVVVKSHGHADDKAYMQAILEAAQAARKELPQRIDSLIQQYHLEA